MIAATKTYCTRRSASKMSINFRVLARKSNIYLFFTWVRDVREPSRNGVEKQIITEIKTKTKNAISGRKGLTGYQHRKADRKIIGKGMKTKKNRSKFSP